MEELSKRNKHYAEKFYNPLSLTGYLTPLQRKKLRERRNQTFNSFELKKPNGILKSRVIKQKNVQNKNKQRNKKMKSKESIAQVQCMAASFFKTTNICDKSKKFFKTSSSDRLAKAHFCMPLVCKRSASFNIDKCVKDSYTKKECGLRDHCSNAKRSRNTVDVEIIWNDSATCLVQDKKKSCCDIFATPQGGISGIEMNDNSLEKSVFDFDWPSDDLLLKRQEKARAIVKKQKVIKEFELKLEDDENAVQKLDEPKKLYPVFYIASKSQSKSSQDTRRKTKNICKRVKDSGNGGEQMVIDAGQKEFGAKICSTCNMVYSIGLEEDERLHSNYHNKYLIHLKFLGWKEENVIGEYRDGRVIIVRNNDQSFKLRKIKDVLEIVNRDLGCSSAVIFRPDQLFILFISNTKQVAGCVVAEPVSSAYRVMLDDSELALKDHLVSQNDSFWRMGSWCLSPEMESAVCGVNRIWVAHNYRRRKVASRMIDCLRCHFIHGHVVDIQELAFTDPSLDGREFAATYTGTDNFLVYR